MRSSTLLKLRLPFICTCVMAAVALCVLGFVYGQKVTFASQWPLFEALRNTAAIIFAVVGAWMAIIYPERLRMSFGKDGNTSGEKSSANIKLLLTPAVHSTAILVILLLVGLIAPLVKPLSFALLHVEFFRGLSYSILSALTCWQIAIVVLAMFPAETVQTAVNAESAKQAMQGARDRLRQSAPNSGG